MGLIQSKGIERFPLEDPLVGKVVDSIDQRGPGEKRIVLVFMPDDERNQCGLPVMAVDDVGTEIEPFQEINDTLTEKSETLTVVRIVSCRCAIEGRALKIFFIFYQVHRDIPQRSLAQQSLLHGSVNGDLKTFAGFFDGEVAGLHTVVKGHDDANIVSVISQGLWQRPGNIGQAAGFGKR